MDAVTQVPAPVNEPVHSYAPGTAERARLEAKLKELGENPIDLPMTIGGEKRMGGGERVDVVQPHNHKAVIGTFAGATEQDAQDAVDAALAAAPAWRAMSFDDRAAIILRAAELLSGPWRETLAASTMLGQGKTAQQAEIDCPCELVDFWRFNVHYARQILAEQPPANSPGVWNRMDHRPLEGFVYAITPFNFSAIAANLPTAPALMGNVVVWKPSPTQTHAAVLLMQLLEEAGLPKGVINLVTGDGIAVSEVALNHRDLAGVHFTGSTPTFQHLWKTVGNNIANYRTYPRLVGETGGKDFVVAHPSADRAVLKTALTRGSFEYQGQKCSASSRAYVPASIWNSGFKEEFAAEVDGITMGDVTDLSHFMGAVIDARSFAKNKAAIDRAAADPTCTIVMRRYVRRLRRLLRPPDRHRVRRPGQRGLHHRVLRPDPGRPRLRGREVRRHAGADGVGLRLRADRRRHLQRPCGRRVHDGQAALRRLQLLHQRQVDRCRRRPAALRWRPWLRHQRQGGRPAEPSALDPDPRHQGDAGPADRVHLPAPGLTPPGRPHRAPRPALRLPTGSPRRPGGGFHVPARGRPQPFTVKPARSRVPSSEDGPTSSSKAPGSTTRRPAASTRVHSATGSSSSTSRSSPGASLTWR